MVRREIDAEVKNILERSYAEAKEILEQHRDQLELVSNELLKCETLDAAAFNRLIGRPPKPKAEGRPGLEIAPPALGKM